LSPSPTDPIVGSARFAVCCWAGRNDVKLRSVARVCVAMTKATNLDDFNGRGGAPARRPSGLRAQCGVRALGCGVAGNRVHLVGTFSQTASDAPVASPGPPGRNTPRAASERPAPRSEVRPVPARPSGKGVHTPRCAAVRSIKERAILRRRDGRLPLRIFSSHGRSRLARRTALPLPARPLGLPSGPSARRPAVRPDRPGEPSQDRSPQGSCPVAGHEDPSSGEPGPGACLDAQGPDRAAPVREPPRDRALPNHTVSPYLCSDPC
jgi:hypothetical protein